MYIRMIKPYGKWVAGNCPDIQRRMALELIQRGIAMPLDGTVPTERQQDALEASQKNEPPQPTVVVVPQQTNSRLTKPRGRNRKKM